MFVILSIVDLCIEWTSYHRSSIRWRASVLGVAMNTHQVLLGFWLQCSLRDQEFNTFFPVWVQLEELSWSVEKSEHSCFINTNLFINDDSIPYGSQIASIQGYDVSSKNYVIILNCRQITFVYCWFVVYVAKPGDYHYSVFSRFNIYSGRISNCI